MTRIERLQNLLERIEELQAKINEYGKQLDQHSKELEDMRRTFDAHGVPTDALEQAARKVC